MYYLGSKNEDEFVTTAVKLGCPMLAKKIDHITTAAMWRESNISKKSQRIVLRYLLNFFGARLVVPVFYITGYESYDNIAYGIYVYIVT